MKLLFFSWTCFHRWLKNTIKNCYYSNYSGETLFPTSSQVMKTREKTIQIRLKKMDHQKKKITCSSKRKDKKRSDRFIEVVENQSYRFHDIPHWQLSIKHSVWHIWENANCREKNTTVRHLLPWQKSFSHLSLSSCTQMLHSSLFWEGEDVSSCASPRRG